MKLTISEFRERFPTNDACLDYLFYLKYDTYDICPSCGYDFSYKRVNGRKSYQCGRCRNQIYPTAGTVFHQTTTPLTFWFYAIYLFTTTRNGVAAKELERQLNICYKTALRMAHQIKKLMCDRIEYQLSGEVMIDETFLGGRTLNKHAWERELLNKGGRGAINKTAVFGIMSKDGLIFTRVMNESSISKSILQPIISEKVSSDSVVVTDGHGSYMGLNKKFKEHHVVEHRKGIYVKDGFTTNNIENYWSTLKRMIKGTHIHVSDRHLQKYVDENSFRYTHRHEPHMMLDIILKNVFLTPS